MPVRKPPKNYRSLTGAFYSHKNKQTRYFESKLERDLFLVLEFDKSVTAYEEQPMELSYTKNGKKLRYTPDCLVHYKQEKESCVIEVKYSDEIEKNREELIPKYTQVEELLSKQNIDFKLFSEKEINETALENMNYIYNYVTLQNTDKSYEVLNYFKAQEELCYEELLNLLASNKYEQATYVPYIWFLVLDAKIEIDIETKISKSTILKVCK